jgi:hypothetical protein
LVLLEQDSTPFSLQAYWYRPDYPAARFIDTALLRTCRLVYIETWNILLRNVTHRRWLGIDERKCPNSESSFSNCRLAVIDNRSVGSWFPCTAELHASRHGV